MAFQFLPSFRAYEERPRLSLLSHDRHKEQRLFATVVDVGVEHKVGCIDVSGTEARRAVADRHHVPRALGSFSADEQAGGRIVAIRLGERAGAGGKILERGSEEGVVRRVVEVFFNILHLEEAVAVELLVAVHEEFLGVCSVGGDLDRASIDCAGRVEEGVVAVEGGVWVLNLDEASWGGLGGGDGGGYDVAGKDQCQSIYGC